MRTTYSFLDPVRAAKRLDLSKPALMARLNRLKRAKDGTYPLTHGVSGVKIGNHWRIRFEEAENHPISPVQTADIKDDFMTVLMRKVLDLKALAALTSLMDDSSQPVAAKVLARYLLAELKKDLRKAARMVKTRR